MNDSFFLPMAVHFTGQNAVAENTYQLVSLVFAMVFAGFSVLWATRRRKFNETGRMILGIALVSLSEMLLTEFFSVSRNLGRPGAMAESWWPIVFRAVMLVGAGLHLSGYTRRQIAALLVAGLLMTAAVDETFRHLYGKG